MKVDPTELLKALKDEQQHPGREAPGGRTEK